MYTVRVQVLQVPALPPPPTTPQGDTTVITVRFGGEGLTFSVEDGGAQVVILLPVESGA